MPRIAAHLGGLQGKVVALWGLAFKPRTDDMREAPALAIIEGLLAKGASVRAYDPKARPREAARCPSPVHLVRREATTRWRARTRCVLVTEWNEFREPDFGRIKTLMRHPAIFDGRNIYNPTTVQGAGLPLRGIGRR